VEEDVSVQDEQAAAGFFLARARHQLTP
jgi:hypothetical protein